MTLVKNRSLDKYNLKKILSHCSMIVTFNGLSFDVPVLNRCFNRIVPDVPHLNLRFPLKRLGFTGGLKLIEQKLGIMRSERTAGMSGNAAVSLWHDYVATGNQDSLEFLVEYNTEDVVNLRPIADFVFAMMKKKVMMHVA